jgi:predicted nucleotidyltransferase
VIPRLRRDGTLPVGVHQATLDQILAAYAPINEQRQLLNDSLWRVVWELRKHNPTYDIYVDGSYVTSKAEPGDVDLLVITTQASTRDLVLYLDQVCPVEAVSVSIEVEPTLSNPIFDLFTETRQGRRKGILQII